MRSNPNPQGSLRPGYSPRPITIIVPPGQEVRIVVDDGSGGPARGFGDGGGRGDSANQSPSPRSDSANQSPAPRSDQADRTKRARR